MRTYTADEVDAMIGQALAREREALAEQPAPVAKPHEQQSAERGEPVSGVVIREGLPTLLQDRDIKYTDQRLYTSPPPRKPWVGLTDEQIGMAFRKAFPVGGVVFTNGAIDFARAIEAKLKAKNTGEKA